MSIGELLLRIFDAIQPILPGGIAVVAATLVVMPILHIRARSAWLRNEGFALAGLFFGLDTRGIVCIACAWLKLIFPIVYIISFEKLVLIQFVMIAVPGLIVTVLAGSPAKVGNSLLYLILELVGLLCAGLICGYIKDVGAGDGFLLVYIAIGTFLALFGLYTFMVELENISGTRKISAADIWGMIEDEVEK